MNIQWFESNEKLDSQVSKHVRKTSIVLDIGCANRPQNYFMPNLHICLEPHEKYISLLREKYGDSSTYLFINSYANQFLPMIHSKSVDTVFLLDVIEHMTKEEGFMILDECKRVARAQLIVATPIGFMHQHIETKENDQYGGTAHDLQEHLSGWEPADFNSSWIIFASNQYHKTSGDGTLLPEPVGRMYCICNLDQGFSRILTPSILAHQVTTYFLSIRQSIRKNYYRFRRILSDILR